MRRAISLFFIFLVCVAAVDLPTFPNIGYLGHGYDYFYGNPHTTNINEAPDPGFRGVSVFDLSSYSAGGVTQDQMYRIPDGTEVLNTDACSLDFASHNITGGKSYQESLDTNVKLDISGGFGMFSAHFGASEDFKTVDASTTNQSSVFVETTASCCAYRGNLQEFTPPPFTKNFISAVKEMPIEVSSEKSQNFFMKFLSTFGTHYTTQVTMGGIYGDRFRLKDNGWTTFTSSDMKKSIETGAQAASFYSASGQYQSEDNKQAAQQFLEQVADHQVFMKGGKFPEDLKVTTWMANSRQDPMPLTFTIRSIADLLSESYFPEDKNITLKYNAFVQTLQNYCQILAAEGRISSCETPTDHVLPAPVNKKVISMQTVRGIGAYATCPANYIAVSCSCGSGCGSNILYYDTGVCWCTCANMDWTDVHCMKLNF